MPNLIEINKNKPLKDGTRLSGFVKAAKNIPPRQCDHCVWYEKDTCSHPVVMVDPEIEGETGKPKSVEDLDCCDYFASHASVLVYMLRHGDTQLNDEGAFRGWLDVEINEKGIEQAKLAGHFLKDKGITCIIASPLKRSVKTAKIVAEIIGIEEEKIIELRGFLPWDVGELSGQNKEKNHHVIQYALDNPEWVIPDGESLLEFGERFRESFTWVIKEAEKGPGPILVVFHTSNVIQAEHQIEGKPENSRPEAVDSVTPGGVVAVIKSQSGDEERLATEPVLGKVGSETHYGS